MAQMTNFNEPNVIPMIDVMLVLLIIFMMQVPLSRKAMDVQVPPEQQVSSAEQAPSNQIVLVLGDDGSYSVNNDTLPLSQLDAHLRGIFDNRPAKLIFVKAGRRRKYQEVIEAMDIARGAGVQVVGFTPKEAEAAVAGQ